ncbi:acyltransferase family protein [Variovorax beijingensis]|uniref:acyltransferase family protein n=1 Tax=Variovorax beijingensis TaxID=2496117 RepID=UPI003F6A1478
MDADSRVQPPSLSYRPEIDGLRAIAVLSVLLFHVNSEWVPGGFVGVDIFFAISGYLITSIVFRDVVAGRFSFARFYKRRILRIAPAYFAVTIATLAAGFVLLLPEDLLDLAKSALWSTFSVPNVYFWKFLDTSYFAADTNQVPLLHLWSLGVEEQFYFLWPAMLLGSYRFLGKRWFLAPLGLIAVASFYLADEWAVTDFAYAYYMLPARAGELLAGGLLALALHGRGTESVMPRWANELAALLGYGLIGYGLFALDGDSRFPGYNALYPCLGTVMLILAGRDRDCWATRPLAFKPVVVIGLISYSLYLWHWPILAFFRYFAVDIDAREGLFLMAGILAISALSYRYIELPFRKGVAPAWRVPRVAGGYAVATILVAAGAWLVVHSQGFSASARNERYRVAAASMLERTQAAFKYRYNCQSSRFDPRVFDDPRCIVGLEYVPQGHRVDVLLVGDSNAAHYIGVLGEIGKAYGFAFRNVSLSSCPPVFELEHRYGKRRDPESCRRYRQSINREADPYGVVVMGAQWASHDRNPNFRKDFEATVDDLRRRGKQVVILGLVPRFQAYGVNCELRRLRMPSLDCESRSRRNAHVNDRINDYLRSLTAVDTGVSYLDVVPVLCPDGRCAPYVDGLPVYYDPGHLSMTGSWEIGRKLVAESSAVPRVLKELHTLSPSLGRKAVVRSGMRVESQVLGRLAQPLPDGFVFPFRHAVRWDRVSTLSSGRRQRSVDVDILATDPARGMRDLERMLLEAGFVASRPREHRRGVAKNYRHDDGRWINTIYWPRPAKKHAAGARGRATIGWILPRDAGNKHEHATAP